LGAGAAAVETDRHLITDGERRHVGTDIHHGSAALMAQDAGKRERQVPMLDGDVGVADAGSGDLYDYFIGCWFLKFDLGEGERRAHFLHYSG
jgi:hypothetical protein